MQQPEDPWSEDDGAFARLLDAARAGQDWAWEAIYRQFSPVVLGYLRSQGVPEVVDLGGQVFLQVVRDLHRFDGNESAFRAWVVTLTHQQLRAVRASRPGPEQSRSVTALAPRIGGAVFDPSSLDGLSREELLSLLNLLSEEQRDVLLLRLLGDLSVPEAAAAMGKRPSAVRALQRLALRNLERALDGRAHSPSNDPQAGG